MGSWILRQMYVTEGGKTKYQIGYLEQVDSSDVFVPIGEPYDTLPSAEDKVHYLNGGLTRLETDRIITLMNAIGHGIERLSKQ